MNFVGSLPSSLHYVYYSWKRRYSGTITWKFPKFLFRDLSRNCHILASIPKEKILLSGIILINVLSPPKFRLCIILRRKTIETRNALIAIGSSTGISPAFPWNWMQVGGTVLNTQWGKGTTNETFGLFLMFLAFFSTDLVIK